MTYQSTMMSQWVETNFNRKLWKTVLRRDKLLQEFIFTACFYQSLTANYYYNLEILNCVQSAKQPFLTHSTAYMCPKTDFAWLSVILSLIACRVIPESPKIVS